MDVHRASVCGMKEFNGEWLGLALPRLVYQIPLMNYFHCVASRLRIIHLLPILLLLIFSRYQYGQHVILAVSNLDGAITGCDCSENPYGGLDRLLGLSDSLRGNGHEVMIVSSGDLFGTYKDWTRDSLIATHLRGELGVLLPGDQEFIYPAQNFLGNEAIAEVSLAGAIQAAEPSLHVSAQMVINKRVVGFTGWHTQASFQLYAPTLWQWESRLARLRQEIAELRSNCEVIILLLHDSYTEAIDLVAAGIRPDVIICGHTQEVYLREHEGVIIVQPGMAGEMFARIDIGAAITVQFYRVHADTPQRPLSHLPEPREEE
jgi:2',3'-cyclic-nucleotide 2'-phosphodiesterase (5'-nucleotidase family)